MKTKYAVMDIPCPECNGALHLVGYEDEGVYYAELLMSCTVCGYRPGRGEFCGDLEAQNHGAWKEYIRANAVGYHFIPAESDNYGAE